MNRRTLLKKAAAIAVAVPAGAVALKALPNQAQSDFIWRTGVSGGNPIPAGKWKPPPPDVRSPEQVVEDSRDEHIEHTARDMEGYEYCRKFSYRVDPDIQVGVARRLSEKGLAFQWRTIRGQLALVCNGNVLLPIT